MTGCHYNGDGLSLFEPVFIEEGRWNYADRTVYAASEGKDRSIRAAAAKEFMRVAPEEVSINGSFTTRIYREEAFTHILKINRIC